jgi:hypothetical protein
MNKPDRDGDYHEEQGTQQTGRSQLADPVPTGRKD